MNDQKLYECKWLPRPCPICGENISITIMGHRTRELTSTIGTFIFELYDTVCERCGFIFNRRVPPHDFLAEYYRNSTMLLEPNYDLDARLDLVRQTVEPGLSIMEFGSKRGEFVLALNENNYRADGYDIASELKIGKAYDAALAYYILEHLVDPGAFLELIKRSVRPGGTIIIEVPDFTNYTLHSLYIEHFNHFTRQHLITLITNHNLELIDIFSGHSREYGITAIVRKGADQTNYDAYIDTMDEFEAYWQKKMAEGWGGKLRQN